jgi:hypothetical protein
MKRYNLLNNVTGWSVFVVAAFTYLSTIESTASLWDCSEFILSADRLEVGHPPGSPLFYMLGRLFAIFAPSPEQVSVMVNRLSGLCSAFTILFLFWSITHLARKLVKKSPEEYSLAENISIMGSGVIGALAYTFSDTFWFSAVESEVYAASSLFTAVVFWAILKWEEQADQPGANRWLVLLAYITGLSVGVHLLNLLAVPAIVFVYYFRKYKITRKGIISTSIISIILLASLVWVIIPMTPKIGSWFELIFVNSFGAPINSGLVFYIFLLAAALAYTIYYTRKKGKVVMNTIMLCLAVCLLGYGSFALVVIRSSANLPMDQNSPDNIFALMSYFNRDQYGTRPLLTGPYYNNHEGITKSTFNYIKVGDKYLKEEWKQTTEYRHKTVFPRMWSKEADHVRIYKTYVNGKSPKFSDNIRFFLDYQVGYMYWRYFMWNFVGRQNDMQGSKYDATKGNWLSGIKAIDEARLGPQDKLPEYLAKNKGRNKYYFIPLLLGLLGFAYQLARDKKNFAVVTLLFFFTGIAIVMYLNQTPNEPRERDYAYAGSFYAFAIWIGLAVLALSRLFQKLKLPATVAAPLALLLGIPAPALMAQQNWDDHDRTGRFVATDFGYNYLNSCEPNAILYTFGDNDTFPLWYNQEVEGVRTDIRVANNMYLGADWYYIQMLRRAHDGAPIKSSATPEKVVGTRRTIVPAYNRDSAMLKKPFDMKAVLDFVMNDDPKAQGKFFGDEMPAMNYFPTKILRLPVNRDYVLSKGIVKAKDSAAIVPYLQFTIPDMVYKNSLSLLDFAANNFPDRPIYYGISAETSSYMGINNNLRQEGLAFKLVPEDVRISGNLDIDKTYDLLMNKFRYRGLNDKHVYLDETARRMMMYYRMTFSSLASELEHRGDKERLSKLMDKFTKSLPEMEIINVHHSPYIRHSNPFVRHYFAAGQDEKGMTLSDKLIKEYIAEFLYYSELAQRDMMNSNYELSLAYSGLMNLQETAKRYNQAQLLSRIANTVKQLTDREQIITEILTLEKSKTPEAKAKLKNLYDSVNNIERKLRIEN